MLSEVRLRIDPIRLIVERIVEYKDNGHRLPQPERKIGFCNDERDATIIH